MYRFKVKITVEGVPYEAGDTVSARDVPPGSLTSLLRLSQVEKIEPASASLPNVPAAPEKPTAKK